MAGDDLVDVGILPCARLRYTYGQNFEVSLQLLQSLVEFRILRVGKFRHLAKVQGVQCAVIKQGLIHLLRGLRQTSLVIGDQIILFG